MPKIWTSQIYRCYSRRNKTVPTKQHMLVVDYTLTLLLCNGREPFCSGFLFRPLLSSGFFSPLLFLGLRPEEWTRDSGVNPQKRGSRDNRRGVKDGWEVLTNQKSTSSCAQGWCLSWRMDCQRTPGWILWTRSGSAPYPAAALDTGAPTRRLHLPQGPLSRAARLPLGGANH